MDWKALADVDLFQLERNESLLDSLYGFLEKNELSAAEAARIEPSQLAKMLTVVQRVMKVKGEEARVAMEELLAQQQQEGSSEGGAPNERALMNQIVQLERELRDRDRVIDGLKERGSSPAHVAVNETRVLRQENEDLRMELSEVKRRLDHERGETDRLSEEAATERLKARQLEREIEQLHTDLEEYRKHMNSLGGGTGGVGGASMLRAGEREYRERLRNKDLEIAEQLDKIEELLNVRDDLERQCQELTDELGQVEEQKISILRENEETKQALVEADRCCSELETKNSLLEGQVSDLQECLREKTEAEEQAHNFITEKTKQWEATLSAKDSQLTECQEEVHRLQSQLTEAGKDSTRATVIKLKKQLQDRDQEVSELQEELAKGATALEELSAQLEEERVRSNPSMANTALHKAMESAKLEADGLKQALEQELARRQTCEASAAEREKELTQALERLGKYERGEYGLREAVQEIKAKKEEIAVRDRDIEELTQQVNSLDRQVNELSDFNEMLCERLGVGEGEDVGFAEWRRKREGERKKVQEEKLSLQREVERLDEEKLELRRKLVNLQLSEVGSRRDDGSNGADKEEERRRGGKQRELEKTDSAMDDLQPVVDQLRTQVAQLQRECIQKRRERERLATQLREQVFQDVGTGDVVRDKKREKKEKEGDQEREEEGEKEKGRSDKLAKELRSTYSKLERKAMEVERLKKEVDFLRQAASKSQPVPLPESIPMTSRDVVASLNEHLLHALRAEKGRSQECEMMRTALEKYQQKFSVIIHQQGILYKEYLDSKREWAKEREQLLQQKSDKVAEVYREAIRAEEQANTLERALRMSQNQLLLKEKEITELKLANIRCEAVNREEREGQRVELTATERGRKTAEESVQQLQALIVQKETQCEKYQRLLQEAQSQLQSMAESHKNEVASLVKKLHAQSDSAVLKLKEVSMEAVAMPVVTGATEEQLARLHELEDLIGQQRLSYEAQLKNLQRNSELAKQAYETSLVKARQEIGDMKRRHFLEQEKLRAELSQQSTRVVQLEQELEVMSCELATAQETVRLAPSQTTKSLIEKLRQQLAVKQKQQKALNEALLHVRAELLDATQKALRDHTHQEVTEVNIQRMVRKRTEELEEHVQELSSNLSGIETELEQSREREKEAVRAADVARGTMEQLHLDRERHRREEERWRREREEGRERVRQLEGDLQQSRRTVEQGRAREQRLAREMQTLQQKMDHKPEVEELQRRIKVLQSRLDRQKAHTEALRHQNKAVHVAATPSKPPVEEVTPHVSMAHSSESVLKWEENKRWQRRVDGLRVKLADKTKEAESAVRQVTSLKETLARSDREKNLLQGKIKSLQKSLADVEKSKEIQKETHSQTHVAGVGSHGDDGHRGDGYHGDRTGEQYVLKKRVYDLEEEVARLKRELSVDRDGELRDAELKNQQLVKSVETLQRQLRQESSESCQLPSVGERESELERELLETKKENMELRFDYEQAIVELPRLRGLIRDQEQYIESLVQAGETKGTRQNGTKVHPVGVATGNHTPSLEELQRVISAMRNVIEKLQRENERLRREGKGGREGRKGEREKEGGGRVGEREEVKERVGEDKPATPPPKPATSPPKSSLSKIASENERLRKSLKREMERNEKLNISLKTAEIKNSRLKEEFSQSEAVEPSTSRPLTVDHSQEEVVEQLRAEVEKKNQMLMEVKKHLREAAEREREREKGQRLVAEERDALREQVEMLRKELDAFDPSFFEEVEDLKFNYQEAIKRNLQYEEHITKLSQQLGVSPPTIHS